MTLDDKLDEALRETFPASDAFALFPETPCLSDAQLVSLLDELLEAERAGARGVSDMSRAAQRETQSALQAVAKDEARFCAMLTRHIRSLGGEPSSRTGAFYDKLAAVENPRARLDLLNRGQGWVVRRLRDALPRIADAELRTDLQEMLATHVANIESCNALIARASPGVDARE